MSILRVSGHSDDSEPLARASNYHERERDMTDSIRIHAENYLTRRADQRANRLRMVERSVSSSFLKPACVSTQLTDDMLVIRCKLPEQATSGDVTAAMLMLTALADAFAPAEDCGAPLLGRRFNRSTANGYLSLNIYDIKDAYEELACYWLAGQPIRARAEQTGYASLMRVHTADVARAVQAASDRLTRKFASDGYFPLPVR